MTAPRTVEGDASGRRLASLEHVVAELRGRLRLLEDERSIACTMSTYAHTLDYGLEDAFVDCWTEDATLHWWGERAPFVGRPAIREAFRQHTHAPEAYHKHVVFQARIAVTEDTAVATSYFIRVDRYEGDPEIRNFGRYWDAFIRCEDGNWRFSARRVELEARRSQPGEADLLLLARASAAPAGEAEP